jgi:hypothetical protein
LARSSTYVSSDALCLDLSLEHQLAALLSVWLSTFLSGVYRILCPSGDDKLNSWRAACASVASEYLGHLFLKNFMKMNCLFSFFF